MVRIQKCKGRLENKALGGAGLSTLSEEAYMWEMATQSIGRAAKDVWSYPEGKNTSQCLGHGVKAMAHVHRAFSS